MTLCNALLRPAAGVTLYCDTLLVNQHNEARSLTLKASLFPTLPAVMGFRGASEFHVEAARLLRDQYHRDVEAAVPVLARELGAAIARKRREQPEHARHFHALILLFGAVRGRFAGWRIAIEDGPAEVTPLAPGWHLEPAVPPEVVARLGREPNDELAKALAFAQQHGMAETVRLEGETGVGIGGDLYRVDLTHGGILVGKVASFPDRAEAVRRLEGLAV